MFAGIAARDAFVVLLIGQKLDNLDTQTLIGDLCEVCLRRSENSRFGRDWSSTALSGRWKFHASGV